MAAQFLPAEPSSMELPEPHYQVEIGRVVERSFALWVEVANRLRPPTDTKIHEGLHQCGDLFVAAKARKSVISWKRARELAEGLELLRRIVSSALQAPLPLTWTTWYTVVPMEYDSKAAFSITLQHTCRTVEDDIHSMFDDERTTN
ncbi:uncharacterized protein [Miscanthus floridulus]|uniref:uncharacterized protein n=1 Tax=Miscanthus floridulus TaxID=154761 RepID=UPI0034575FA6